MTTALRAAVDASGKPVKAIAAEIGLPRPSYLNDALNPQHDTQFQLRWLVPFMKCTGSLAPLRALASELGCAVVELPDASAGDDELFSEGAKVTEQLGEAFMVIRQSLLDRRVDRDEFERSIKELDDVIDATLRFRAVAVQSLEKLSAVTVEKPAPARMTLPCPEAAAGRRLA